MKSKTLNMTEGEPVRLMCAFALPMLIGNLFQQLYNLTDSVIVGRLMGLEALAAIGATGSATFLFFSLCNGISSGGGIVTAQQFGGGNEDNVKRAIVSTAWLVFAVAGVICLVSNLAAGPLLRFLDTPEEILADSLIYLRTQCFGVFCVALYNYAAAMLRALGDSKTPLYFLIFSCLLNVGMDFLFVGTFSMGVFGAAFATVLAQLISGVTCLIYAFRCNEYFSFTREHLRPEPDMIRSAARVGIPLGLQGSMIAVSCAALQRFVNSFGSVAVAAFTATSRIEQLVQQPYGTMGTALSTFAGQNYGAKRIDRIRLGLVRCMEIVGAFSVLMIVVMQLWGSHLVGLFVEDDQMVAMGATALQITSSFYLFLGTIYVVRGALNGVGDAFFSFLNGIVELTGRIAIPLVLASCTSLGVWGIWYATGLTWMLTGIASLIRAALWQHRRLRTGRIVARRT